MTRTVLRAGLAACLLLLAGAGLAEPAVRTLPSLRLNAGIHNINAEVARTPDERAKGLMFRTQLGANDGMLFVFERPATQCFWMRNTFIALSIAFVADDGTIVDLDEMQPRTEESHCSTKPVRYVLEMNRGWFSSRGIKPGTRLQGRPFQP